MAINVLRGIAQQTISSGINKAAADIRSGLLDAINPRVPQNRSPAAQLNRSFGKHNIQYFSFPQDVLSAPGAGNQGHYILFYIQRQNHTKIKFGAAADAANEAKAAEKAKNDSGGKDQIEGYEEASGVAANHKRQEEEALVASYANTQTVTTQRAATLDATHAIALYMPPSVSVQYGADYQDTEIGAGASIGAAAFDDIMSGQSLASTANTALKALGPEVSDGMIRMALGAVDMIPGLEGAMEVIEMKRGYIRAPQMELAFKGISKRSFTYDFKMIPKSKKEADEIKKIITAFKTNMLPTLIGESVRRQIVPSTFKIDYMYKDGINENLHQISTCVLESMNVTYGGDRYRTYEDGVPVETAISLSFKEMDLITREDIEQGY